MDWYYVIDREQHGPVSQEELSRLVAAGSVAPTDLVWNESMEDQWVAASTVPKLFVGSGSGAAPVLPEGLRPGPVLPGGLAAAAAPVPSRAVDGRISCSAAVSPAWQGMKSLLFRPFDLGFWFVLGFSAWLATWGKGQGSFNYGGGSSNMRQQGRASFDADAFSGMMADMAPMIQQVKAYLGEHGPMIWWIGGSAVLLVIVVSVVVLWVRCRGKFMFLDNIVNGRAEVKRPWARFRQHGNSLFLWSLVYGLVCFAVTLLLGLLLVFSVVMPCIKAGAFVDSVFSGIAVGGSCFLLFALMTAYISRFLEDFVIPIMYEMDLKATEAWGKLFALLKANFGRFILYGIFYAILSIAGGLCLVVVVLLTCCIAGCLMGIPYIGAVVLLPWTVFFRMYSLAYLEQFGEAYRMRAEG